jgi:hypothetical protein
MGSRLCTRVLVCVWVAGGPRTQTYLPTYPSERRSQTRAVASSEPEMSTLKRG